MKYSFIRLFLELTRKCNYKCAHCMRRSTEDLTITQEIIDTMFSQIEQAHLQDKKYRINDCSLIPDSFSEKYDK